MDHKQKNKSKKEKKQQKIVEKEEKEKKEENKKKKEDKDNNDDDNEQQQSESNPDINFANLQPQEQQNIEVSFCVAQVSEDYYHSLKTIMRRYSQITSASLSSIVDAVISHNIAANIVIADDEDGEEDDNGEEDNDDNEEDEDNAYSIIAVLDYSQKITNQLKQIALTSYKKHANNSQIVNILKGKQAYLLMNERLPNLPSFLIPSIHQVLLSDIQKQSNQKKGTPVIPYLLSISQIQFQGSDKLDDFIFAKWQDYQMCKRSKAWWVGENVQCRKKKVQMKRLYWLIDWKSYQAAANNLNTYLNQ